MLAIQDTSPMMEESFRNLLTKNGIPKELIEHMKNENILAPCDLPRYCLEKQGIMDHLVNACEATRGNRNSCPTS